MLTCVGVMGMVIGAGVGSRSLRLFGLDWRLLDLNPTKIEYLQYTWNPLVGCSGIGCAVAKACWARGQAKRQKPKYAEEAPIKGELVRGCQDCYDFKPHYHLERVNQPLLVKKPARIGVCFMGDLFDKSALLSPLQRIFNVMGAAFWHTFIVLTKQPQNIPLDLVFPSNVWLGVSVNLQADLWRVEELKKRKAALKFVSFEPLFEEITDLHHSWLDLSGIDWVIIGAQKRPNLQPEEQWVGNLIMKAFDAGAKVFLKNNLACIDKFGRLQEIPEVRSNA